MAINALDNNGLLYFWQKIKNLFVQKESGKGLSTNDYTTAEKQKLAGLSNYTLPTASADTKGGVKIGAGLTMNGDVLSATGGGTADSVDWSNVQNKPASFTPSTHTHAQSDVTGLADALAAKIAASEKGQANGVATLDANGLIPSNQIAGSLEDIVDGYYDSTTDKFYAEAAKTTELEKVIGRIYVDITEVSGTPKLTQYRWGGSAFSKVPGYVEAITNAQIDTILAS